MERNKKRKKRILMVLGIWTAVGIAFLILYLTTFSGTKRSDLIGEEKAKEIALEHAGLTKEEVRFIRSEKDDENGMFVYEIEFFKGTKEYDYTIDAETGRLISFDSEIDGYHSEKASTKIIDLTEATEIALKHVNLKAEDVHIIKASLSKEFKKPIYDVEFYSDGMEYDFEIDAETGMILDFDKDVEGFLNSKGQSEGKKMTPVDESGERRSSAKGIEKNAAPAEVRDNTQAKNGAQDKLLSMEEAKAIALKHLNRNGAEPVFTKAYLDKDDTRINYEFEIHVGTAEYEYEIDAKTGEILSCDFENDDNEWNN